MIKITIPLREGDIVYRVRPYHSGPHAITRIYTPKDRTYKVAWLSNNTWEWVQNLRKVRR